MGLLVPVQYSTPIRGKALAWHGLGTVENYGLGASANWFLTDAWALGIGLDNSIYSTPTSTAYGLEIEGSSRRYIRSDPGSGVFWSMTGGFVWTSESISPRGTPWKFTFGFGPGIEVPLHDRTSLGRCYLLDAARAARLGLGG